MKKKFLVCVLTLIMCCTACLALTACGEDADTLTVTPSGIVFSVGQSQSVALAGYTFKFERVRTDNVDSELLALEQNMTYEQAVEKGLYVLGFDTRTATGTNETRTLSFSYRGTVTKLEYTVQ